MLNKQSEMNHCVGWMISVTKTMSLFKFCGFFNQSTANNNDQTIVINDVHELWYHIYICSLYMHEFYKSIGPFSLLVLIDVESSFSCYLFYLNEIYGFIGSSGIIINTHNCVILFYIIQMKFIDRVRTLFCVVFYIRIEIRIRNQNSSIIR